MKRLGIVAGHICTPLVCSWKRLRRHRQLQRWLRPFYPRLVCVKLLPHRCLFYLFTSQWLARLRLERLVRNLLWGRNNRSTFLSSCRARPANNWGLSESAVLYIGADLTKTYDWAQKSNQKQNNFEKSKNKSKILLLKQALWPHDMC